MDRTDLKLLAALQRDGRASVAELAEQVSLSATPCARRLRRLEEDGVIDSYAVRLNRVRLGLATTVFVSVRLMHHRSDATAHFEEAVLLLDKVLACHVVSGSHDYLLEVACGGLSDYEAIVSSLQALDMVQDITSHFAIRTVKRDGKLPLDALLAGAG